MCTWVVWTRWTSFATHDVKCGSSTIPTIFGDCYKQATSSNQKRYIQISIVMIGFALYIFSIAGVFGETLSSRRLQVWYSNIYSNNILWSTKNIRIQRGPCQVCESKMKFYYLEWRIKDYFFLNFMLQVIYTNRILSFIYNKIHTVLFIFWMFSYYLFIYYLAQTGSFGGFFMYFN